MEACVVKLGFEMFDALHAYGLAALLANATDGEVKVVDYGLSYELRWHNEIRKWDVGQVLAKTLELPGAEAEPRPGYRIKGTDVPTGNLDGLLASLFTTPGVRAASVADLEWKQGLAPTVGDRGIEKARKAVDRWTASLRKRFRGSLDWFRELLLDYSPGAPETPRLRAKRDTDIAVTMMLDPALGYATRRALSDGHVQDKVNLAVEGPRHASILAYVGAARFLRAQRVTDKLVISYVPQYSTVTVGPTTSLPLLRGNGLGVEHALVQTWFRYARMTNLRSAHLPGTAYYVLQTQGAQQSIAVGQGYLDCQWLRSLERRVGRGLINTWTCIFAKSRQELTFELDALLDSLLRRSGDRWADHLYDVAIAQQAGTPLPKGAYSVGVVREVFSEMVHSSRSTSMRAMIEGDQGTVRFGHALRQLRDLNPAQFQEALDDLEVVTTQPALLRVLTRVVQECTVGKAKSPFMIIPDDEDLALLLDHAADYGVANVAHVLAILSVLRYPKRALEEALIIPADE